jgi:Cu-Zn family superoxide dismutase
VRTKFLLVLVAAGLGSGLAVAEPPKGLVRFAPAVQPAADPASGEKHALALIEGKSGSSLTGKAVFVQRGNSVALQITLENASPGIHAIHLHEKGDCSAPDGMSAGPHWNPEGQAHGKWGHSPFHRGDIGNIEVGKDGKGSTSLTSEVWSVGGAPETDVTNKAVVVHAGPDDFATQPTGNAGGRIGCGVVVAGK